MKILENIRQQKILEVRQRKTLYPVEVLEQSLFFDRSCASFKSHLSDTKQSGIIAEFKRRSPSKGNINRDANVQVVTQGYIGAGAVALSVLTDERFFGAGNNDLKLAREFNCCPILRKDFILDEYQIIESKAMGADAILLIAKLLPAAVIVQFTQLAHQLGMEVILETNNETEIQANSDTNADIIGINNRNLNTFEVDIENSIRLAGLLPVPMIKIAESGIDSPATIGILKKNGFAGFLIGEYFMKSNDPVAQCQAFVNLLRI